MFRAIELFLILMAVLKIFGARRIPEVGAGMAEAVSNFKKASRRSEINITPVKEAKKRAKKPRKNTAVKKA